MEERGTWLRLDIEDGWQIIVPVTDTRPHATLSESEADALKKSGREVELAGIDCPCKPKIDLGNRQIIHNSFEDEERIQKAINNPT